ncbi:unnamed protein product, partial [Vitis vinifera]
MTGMVKSLDFIIGTVSPNHSFDLYLSLLKTAGTFVLVGCPNEVKLNPLSILVGMKTISGSATGGMKETQEMLDFCAAHKIHPNIEVVPIQYANEALERLIKSDVKYRFVVDIENSLNKISSSRLQCTPWLPTGRSSFSVFPLDLSEKGLGTQSKRFALLVDDLKVKVTNNQIYSSTFPLHRLMAAIFFLDPTSSAPLLCRVKISFADNVPLLQQASRNTARNVVHLDPPCHNARFKPCAHMGRSDLEIFVEMNQCSRKWQYPICIKKYSLENVIIGPYFQSHDILDAVLWGRCN